MEDLFVSGRIVDWVIALLVLEMVGLLAWQTITGTRVFCVDVLSGIAAGLFLLLALRCALRDLSWMWVALCLSGALAAHLASLWARGRVKSA